MQVVAKQAGKQVVKQQAKKQAKKQVKKQVKKKMKQQMQKKMKQKAKKKVKAKVQQKVKDKAKKKAKEKVKKKAKEKVKSKVKDKAKKKAKEKVKNKVKKKVKEKIRDEVEDRIQEAVEDEIGDFFGRKDKSGIPQEQFMFREKKKPKGIQGRVDNMKNEMVSDCCGSMCAPCMYFVNVIKRIFAPCINEIKQYCTCTVRTESDWWVTRMCVPGTYEYEAISNVIGFITGCFMVYIFYYIFVFGKDYEPYFALAVTTVMGGVMSFGMAFSKDVRCIVLLTVPQLFSSKGRSILMAYGFLLVMAGPMANLTENMDIASQSQLCSGQLAANQTRELFEMATAPLAGLASRSFPISKLQTINIIFDRLTQTVDDVKKVTDKIAESFRALNKALSSIGGIMNDVHKWLKDIVTRCNDKFGKPERACLNAIYKGKKNCEKKFRLKFMCKIVNIAKPICNLLRVGKLLCYIPGKVMSYASTKTTGMVNEIKDEFYVEIKLKHSFTMDNTLSRSVGNITGGMIDEIKSRTKQFRFVLRIINQLLTLTFIWLFVKAAMYRKKYLTKDKFDNWYITPDFFKIEERRKALFKETIFPLKWKESFNYVQPTSFRMAKPEKRKLSIGLVIWCTHALYTGMIIGTDSFIFWFLTVIRKHASIKIQLDAPAPFKVRVEGDGLIANIYRRLIDSFEALNEENVTLDVTKCLPEPVPPNYGSYETIVIVFACTLIMVVTEAYGLRLRRVVTSWYYPQRERQRVVWLYNSILKKRGGFLKYLRKQMKAKFDPTADIEKISIVDRIAARSKFWRKIFKFMGLKSKKYCVGCAKPGKKKDKKNFRHCDNPNCKSCYCLECMADLNNMCLLCYRPIDIVGLDELSEERDSSDEEYIK
ncbi:DC-STAMP domain-containing protein 2-like [Antedon mediterranea]|uniref:DC-STAMP domain-containing protein 2-like n=1 Tax=Antedon mediterranea TaxID=105859 RepID=UPI003AF6555C